MKWKKGSCYWGDARAEHLEQDSTWCTGAWSRRWILGKHGCGSGVQALTHLTLLGPVSLCTPRIHLFQSENCCICEHRDTLTLGRQIRQNHPWNWQPEGRGWEDGSRYNKKTLMREQLPLSSPVPRQTLFLEEYFVSSLGDKEI